MNIEELEMFFDYDLEIKNMIISLKPPMSEENERTKIEYVDKLLKALEDIKRKFNRMFEITELNSYQERINTTFDNYKNDVINSGTNMFLLGTFYKDRILRLRDDFNKSLIENIKGYYDSDVDKSLKKAESINEILHLLHFYVVNNEDFYQSTNKLAEKTVNDYDEINLYGKNNEVARKIFDELPSMDSACIDILALNDKIFMMARDLGHALTISIEKENDKYVVNYFIPKVCNVEKVNKLKGVTKLDMATFNAKSSTTGQFRVEKNELVGEIIDFMKNVPTDMDIVRNVDKQSELDEMLEDEIKGDEYNGFKNR